MATFWDIYYISPPIYMFCIYKNQIISIWILYIYKCSTLKFVKGAMPEEALYALLKKI